MQKRSNGTTGHGNGREIRTKWENIDGRRVRCCLVHPADGVWRDARTHPPILLLHGLGCAVDVWRPTLEYLATCSLNRPVFAVDLPGCGRSQGPPKALTIEEQAEWTARFMDALGIPRAHLGGNSLGCQVALALARRHPARVGALVLGGPTEGNDMVPFWRVAFGLLGDFLAEPWLYNSVLTKTFLQMGVPRYVATVRRMIEDDPLIRANEVAAPCLILRGTRDAIVPERAAVALASALPCGVYQTIEGAAHAIQFNAPEAFVQRALAFWKRWDPYLCGDAVEIPAPAAVRDMRTA